MGPPAAALSDAAAQASAAQGIDGYNAPAVICVASAYCGYSGKVVEAARFLKDVKSMMSDSERGNNWLRPWARTRRLVRSFPSRWGEKLFFPVRREQE